MLFFINYFVCSTMKNHLYLFFFLVCFLQLNAQINLIPKLFQSIVYPAAVTRDGVRATGTGWLIEPVKIPSSIDVQASNTPLVYSIDRRIVVENADVVEVFTALGIKINNHKNRTLNQGTYLVKADKFISKINIY